MHFYQISGKLPNLMTANISGYTVVTNEPQDKGHALLGFMAALPMGLGH